MNLHDEIMKLQRESYPHNLNREDVLMAYRMGYRDARHDAAKIANNGDAIIDELFSALRQLQDSLLGVSIEVQADAMRNARAVLAKTAKAA